jgi:chromate reductase, NAD(P)H dehydrogenase (quinone)
LLFEGNESTNRGGTGLLNKNADSLTMITILSGTNRTGNKSIKIAEEYFAHYKATGVDAQLYDLQTLPADFSSAWTRDKQSPDFQKQVETYFRGISKMVLVVPEYQGTFPGILKLVFDAVHPNDLKGKKIAMVGLGAGRAGNLRGMDHLSGAFHYLGITVYPFHLPISKVNDVIDQQGVLHDENTRAAIQKHAEGFASF